MPARIFLFLLLMMGLWKNAFSQSSSASTVDSALSAQLFQVIRSGDANALEQMLKKGAQPNTTRQGLSPLMAATLSGSIQQMKILLQYGAAVNYADGDSLTALWYAVPDLERTRLLLDHGADPRLRSKEGYNVLIKVVAFPGTTEVFDLLVAKGADLKTCARLNDLLFTAAGTTDTLLTARLLAAGFNPNDTIVSGDYPINQAAGYRCFNNVKQLVEHGANVNVQIKPWGHSLFSGLTPLMLAALVGDTLSMKYLLDQGADLRLKTAHGMTALMFLEESETDLPQMTKMFLEKGADPTDQDIDGGTALSYALRKGNTRSVQLLKVKLNASSKN